MAVIEHVILYRKFFRNGSRESNDTIKTSGATV